MKAYITSVAPVQRPQRPREPERADAAVADAATPGARPVGTEPVLADVARVAGVSTATVSRYVNQPDKLTAKTRARVRQAIDQLDWVPNAAARSLVSRRSNIVGALFPTLAHEKFHQQLQAFQDRMAADGLAVVVACSAYDPDEGYRLACGLLARGVDALALLGDDFPAALFDLLRSRRIPYVIMFGKSADGAHPCVGLDQAQAYRTITQHLLDLGHMRFGAIFQSLKFNSRVQARLAAVHATLADSGLALRPQHVAVMSDGGPIGRIPFARTSLQQMMASTPAPTAIICGNDMLAVGALLEAKSMGIDVPGALSISGFDDIEIAAHLQPSLTTVQVPDRQIGETAAQYLIDRLAGQSPQAPRMIEVKLLERNSTGSA